MEGWSALRSCRWGVIWKTTNGRHNDAPLRNASTRSRVCSSLATQSANKPGSHPKLAPTFSPSQFTRSSDAVSGVSSATRASSSSEDDIPAVGDASSEAARLGKEFLVQIRQWEKSKNKIKVSVLHGQTVLGFGKGPIRGFRCPTTHARGDAKVPGSITKAKNERTKDTVVDKNPTAVVYPSDRLPAHVVKHFGHAQPHEGPDGVA